MLKGSKETADSAPEALTILWQEGFLKSWHSFKNISIALGKRGNNFSPAELGMALRRSNYLTRRGKPGIFEYIQKKNAVSKEVSNIENQLFSEDLGRKLQKDFKYEMEDLRLNFNRSGNCSAFILRKMLEKLIYIAFARNSLQSKLEDKRRIGGLVGLDAMINIAASVKIHGIPFIMPRTAQEIRGIKFLGDASAHNPLTNVDMKTIIPQMPFIITVYKELARHLK